MKRQRLLTIFIWCLGLTMSFVFLASGSAPVQARAYLSDVAGPSTVVALEDLDSGLASPAGNYRWRDIGDQLYSVAYRTTYNYTQADVQLTYAAAGNALHGTLTAINLKPNFTYQVKLVGTPGTPANERIGLAGRWWQEEWDGSAWANGQNLNNKGDGSSPNPNDETYFARRDILDSTSPTGLHYRFVGYLVFAYLTTGEAGTASLDFQTDSSYHVLWKTSQRAWTVDDGPLRTATFDADLSSSYQDTGGDDYPSQTVSIFGEWERLPAGGVHLTPGEYHAQMILTEESFHGSGGTYAGGWAAAMGADIQFIISVPTAVELVSFTAAPHAGAIRVAWETDNEIDLHGFNLYRAGSFDRQRVRLNAHLLSAQVPGSPVGASYLFLDSSVVPNTTYYYWLEYLDVYGLATPHGPASTTLTRFRAYLPVVIRSWP